MRIRNIGFICEAGVGSSAMGAAIFRRKLAQNNIGNIQVEAYAGDRIPDGLDLLVCQKDFLKMLPKEKETAEVIAVDRLLGGEFFDDIIETIKKRNG